MLDATVLSSRSSLSLKAFGFEVFEADDADHPVAGEDRHAEP